MSTHPPSVLVVGAGELGEAILSALASHPSRPASTSLDVLLRAESINNPSSPTKRAANDRLRALGATLVPGNFVDDDVAKLARCFRGYDIVIQAGGYGLPAGTQMKSTEAALMAGVPRYFPWQFGVDYEAIGAGSAQELFDEMLQVRAALRAQSATSWTVVSTGLFMSYLFLADFGAADVRARTARALGSWANRVTVTTPADVGRATAELAWAPGGHTGHRVVRVAGETLTYARLADVLEEELPGPPWRREEWEVEFLRERLRGQPDNLWYRYQCIFAEGRGVSWDVAETLNGQRGMEMTGVREYVVANFGARK